MKKIKKLVFVLSFFMAYICINIASCEYNLVQAKEYEDSLDYGNSIDKKDSINYKDSTEYEKYINYDEIIDYDEIQNVIDDISKDTKFDFEQSVDKVVKGENVEGIITFSKIKDTIKTSFLEKKQLITSIIAIVLIAAIFTNLGGAFGEGYVTENSFIVTYMILITALISSYRDIYKIGQDLLMGLKTFMLVLTPTYSVASYMSNGINTASAYGILSMTVITIVEIMYESVLLPMITGYIIVGMVNNIGKKQSLSRMQSFIKMIIMWSLKGSVIVVTGLGTVRKIISPSVDMATKKVISSGLKMTPFIGKNISVVTDTVTSAATLIKNSIGGVSLIVIALICIIPIIRIIVYVFLYKIIAIVVESIADKRVVNALECVAEGAKILMYIVMTSGLLFMITIALIAI